MAKKVKKLPEESMGFRYHAPNIPMSAIRRYARQIAEKFQPDKIILFGSYAYGEPHVESDVDLLVVMPAHDETTKAIRIINTLQAPFSLDLIVRTPKRLRRDWEDGDWFLQEVMAKGRTLYEKTDGKVGSEGRGRLPSFRCRLHMRTAGLSIRTRHPDSHWWDRSAPHETSRRGYSTVHDGGSTHSGK